ncbi:MAG: hypothetical protein PHU24_08945 [Sphaerochaetaceae bacterium]|jgi:hypothetical protein|nr:hypothetical protein [Sphaerochaetaceae bacterium]MDD2406568.1 hypothetical protein [Sphaerochaetaceae bacterium]
MRKKHFIVGIAMLMLIILPVCAETTMNGSIELIVSTAKDVKVETDFTIKMPILTGEGPLFQGNNLKVKGLLGLSPVAATVSVDAILTPVAVMELSLGGSMGTGWDLAGDLQGLRYFPNSIPPVQTLSLQDFYYNGRAGAALQFDTAAIVPGDWTSVVIRTYHEFNYQGLINRNANDLWEYELAGFRKNGFNYRSEYLVGYQMPIMLNMVAFMFETSKFNLLDNHGNDTIYDMSVIGNLNFIEGLNLTLVGQFTTKMNDSTLYPKLRGAWRFSRLVAMLKYSF